jgi:ABC-2 type transport system ATP-binding protein
MAFVEVKNLEKYYESTDVKAVDRITFSINEGEIFSLLGPNGAGKTTTISILNTLISPTSGEVKVSGINVLKDPMAVRRRIGVVPQEIALYDELTAEENLRFWGEMQGLKPDILNEEIKDKLRLMELETRSGDRVKTFSGGMKRRLNLAVGMLGSPPLLMLDEPTVAIDPQSRRYILDWVKKINAEGNTILYTTHYMEEAQELSHRIGIMDHGKLIAIGTLEELTTMVGEKQTLQLKLYQEAGGGRLAEGVKEIKGINQVSSHKDEVIMNVDSAEDTLSTVLKIASDLDLSIRTIDIQEPNLEAVFLHLTGRALRD